MEGTKSLIYKSTEDEAFSKEEVSSRLLVALRRDHNTLLIAAMVRTFYQRFYCCACQLFSYLQFCLIEGRDILLCIFHLFNLCFLCFMSSLLFKREQSWF